MKIFLKATIKGSNIFEKQVLLKEYDKNEEGYNIKSTEDNEGVERLDIAYSKDYDDVLFMEVETNFLYVEGYLDAGWKFESTVLDELEEEWNDDRKRRKTEVAK